MSEAALRLKMKVESVKRSSDENGNIAAEEISCRAVFGAEGTTNAQWSKWTPSANLSIQINNPGAFGKVLPGQFFFVDLIPTDKES